MDDKHLTQSPRSLLFAILIVISLVGTGYMIARHLDRIEQKEVQNSDLNSIVVALREQRNRAEVYKISGTVTTVAKADGCWWNICSGELKVKQPWSVAYFMNMQELSLSDYIWDEGTRTLLVRAPAVRPDPPNIDERQQVVAYKGPVITRDMQTKLRTGIARTAASQANAEAAKPENLAAANRDVRAKIAANLAGPLRAVGIRDVKIQIVPRNSSIDSERWDVSRSIAEVLAERSGK